MSPHERSLHHETDPSKGGQPMTASTTIETPTGTRVVKPRKYDKREVRAAYFFLSPWILGFLVFTLGAMIYSLVISFSHYQLATNTARPAGFSNYELLLEDPKVMISLGNTLFYAVLAVPLEIA